MSKGYRFDEKCSYAEIDIVSSNADTAKDLMYKGDVYGAK